MRLLLFGVQIILVTITFLVLVGMAREPDHSLAALLAVASVFAGLLLLTVVLPRCIRKPWLSTLQSWRYLLAAALFIFGLAAGWLAMGVSAGEWRGPGRLTGIVQLALQFAGPWPLTALFAALALLFVTLAWQALWLPPARPTADTANGNKPA